MNLLKKVTATAMFAGVVAAGVAVPAGTANAINIVPCTSNEFVKVYKQGGTICLANRGLEGRGPGDWVQTLWTGNNNINWWADDGVHYLPKWHELKFPKVRWVKMYAYEIL